LIDDALGGLSSRRLKWALLVGTRRLRFQKANLDIKNHQRRARAQNGGSVHVEVRSTTSERKRWTNRANPHPMVV
jgi:hypothetical protein